MTMQMRMVQDMRGFPRMEFNRLVRLESENQGTMQLVGVNYSATGIALQSKRPLPLGEFVELRFTLGEKQRTVVNITGEVMYNNHDHEHNHDLFTAGLKFVGYIDLPDASS